MNPAQRIVFILYYHEEVYLLPSALIVQVDQRGALSYSQKKATFEIIEDYGIEPSKAEVEIIKLIDQLTPDVLLKKFTPVKGRKKIKTLKEALEPPLVKKQFNQHKDRYLNEIFRLIYTHKLPFVIDPMRRDFFQDFIVNINHQVEYRPRLLFKKTASEIQYEFKLDNGNKVLPVSALKTEIVCNNPAWVVINNYLVSIPSINGNLLKPFQNKNALSIRPSFFKEYFEKFILKIANKVNIEAEGFAVKNKNDLDGVRLEFRNDFLNNKNQIELVFEYGESRFFLFEKTKQKTSLSIDSLDDVQILKHSRNEGEEQGYLNQLLEMGMKVDDFGHLDIPENAEDPYSVIAWLTRKQEELKKIGIELSIPIIEGKPILVAPVKRSFKTVQENDWLELKGSVSIGEFDIPIIAFRQNVKDENRFFELPNGQFFLIPLEWFHRLQPIFKFGNVQKESIRLTKAQFPLVEGLVTGKAVELYDAEKVKFVVPETLKATLRPYQLEGLKWLVSLYHNNLGACLADDMGLGKTVQTIATLLYAKKKKEEDPQREKADKPTDLFSNLEESMVPLKALIIMPASLIFNWKQELKKFAPSLIVSEHTGPRRNKNPDLLGSFDVVLTTYHTARIDIEILKDIGFEYVVLDESQQIKNKDSKVFKALSTLNAKHKISLSGTPIENSLADLWSQMQFINPGLLGNFTAFRREFINPIEKHQNEEKKRQIQNLIAPYLLRRTKGEVEKDLPTLSYKVFFSDMAPEQKKLYEKEKAAARNFIFENITDKDIKYNSVVLQTLLKLRQIANHPLLYDQEEPRDSGKFKDILEHLHVLKKGGHKVLLFSQFVSHLNLFKTYFEEQKWKYAYLTGSVSAKDRKTAIETFQSKKDVSFFLISIKAGGAGLNLTAADYVIIADPWWNPSTEKQAIARAHRIGQSRNVIAIKFITKGSVEENILKLQKKKSKLSKDIIDNNEQIKFTKKDLSSLLE